MSCVNLEQEERIDWELQKEQQLQKSIAASAYKKPKRRGCKLPHEYLTKEELEKLNGEVKTMNMNKPIAYKAFRMLSKDMQKLYLTGLVERYYVTHKTVAEMMGTTYSSFSQYLREHGLNNCFPAHPPRSRSMFNQKDWDEFCAGKASESLRKPAEETNEGPASPGTTAPKLPTETVIELVKAGTITVNDAKEMVGLERVSETAEINPALPVPFETASLNIQLKNVKDWNAVIHALDAFSLPTENTVCITVHGLREV